MGSFQVARPTVEPIQQPDVQGNLMRLQQLRGMQQQQQYAQQEQPYRQQIMEQQAQSGAIDLQTAQRNQKDQQALTTAMNQWDGKSLDDLPSLVLKNGGSATAVMGLKQKALEQKQTYAKIAADDATAGKNQIETLKQKNDMIAGAMKTVLQAPDEQLPQALLSTAQQLAQQGLLDQSHLQIAQRLAQSGDIPGIRQSLDVMGKGHMSNTELLAQAKADEDVRHNKADEAAKLIQAQGTQDYRKARLGIEGARLALEQKKASFDMNASTLTGDEFLKTLPPGVQTQVKATANGDVLIPPPSARNPQAQQMRAAVFSYDPTYTDARYKGKQQFKTAGDAQSLSQLSTGMEHADRAIENSKKVGFAPALGNRTLEAPESAAYMQDADFLTGEIGKLVKNGVLAEHEGERISSGMTSARQAVRDAALQETMGLLGGRTRALFQKYQNSTGQALPVNEFFDSKSQQRLQKYGLLEDGATGGSQSQGAAAAAAPAPQTHIFSASAWQRANPKGDVNAAIAAAKQQNYQVTQ